MKNKKVSTSNDIKTNQFIKNKTPSLQKSDCFRHRYVIVGNVSCGLVTRMTSSP